MGRAFAFTADRTGAARAGRRHATRLPAILLAVVLASGLVPSAAPGPARAQASDRPAEDRTRSLEDVHSAFLEDPDLQLEWPDADPPDRPEPPPGWLRELAEFIGDIFAALGPLFRLVFYLMCALAVGSIAWFVGRNLLDARFPALRRKTATGPDESVAEPYRPDVTTARSWLEEADRLAAEGRYAEAVHLLLFRSIEDIQTRRQGSVPRSLTAREIARLETLPDNARDGLAPIIQIVERSFFGGRSVDLQGWQAARDSYGRFAFGEAAA